MTSKDLPVFTRGDKVIHRFSEDGEMIGTIAIPLGNDQYSVDFHIPGRRRNGYVESMRFHASELEHCFIQVDTPKNLT